MTLGLFLASAAVSIVVGRHKNIGVLGGLLLSFVSPGLALAAVLLGSRKGTDNYLKRLTGRGRTASEKAGSDDDLKKKARAEQYDRARTMLRDVRRQEARVSRLEHRREQLLSSMEDGSSASLDNLMVRNVRRLNRARDRAQVLENRLALYADENGLKLKGYDDGRLSDIASSIVNERSERTFVRREGRNNLRAEKLLREVNRRYAAVERQRRAREVLKERMDLSDDRSSYVAKNTRSLHNLNNAKRSYDLALIRLARFADSHGLDVRGFEAEEIKSLAEDYARRRRVTGRANIRQKTSAIGRDAVQRVLDYNRQQREAERIASEKRKVAADGGDGFISLDRLKEYSRCHGREKLASLGADQQSVQLQYSIKRGQLDLGDRQVHETKGKGEKKTRNVKVETPDLREERQRNEKKKSKSKKKKLKK